MNCPVCGGVVYESAIFCGRCGTAVAGNRSNESGAVRTRPSWPWLKIFACTCAAAAAVLIIVTLCLGRPGGPSVRSVPDVVGMDRAQAEARLGRSGFECVVAAEELSSMTPPGAVIRQFPRADTPTSTKNVSIVLSLGSGVTVPDIVGQPHEAASAALEELGLASSVAQRQPSASVAAGSVTQSWPAAGTVVQEGTVVCLALSTGPLGASTAPTSTAVPQVPDVTGRTDAEAKRLLRSAGLTYVIGSKRFSSSTPHGYVISQRPRPGAEVPRSKTVQVALSLGRGVRVPDVLGKSNREASRLLADAGLRVTTRHRHGEAEKDHVLSAVPAVGKTVAAGSSVTLVLSSGPAEGLLRVEAQPGDRDVWVYVDGGEPRGKCPLTMRLPAGEHSLVLWEPSGQKRVVVPVIVEAGRTLTVQKDLGRAT